MKSKLYISLGAFMDLGNACRRLCASRRADANSSKGVAPALDRIHQIAQTLILIP